MKKNPNFKSPIFIASVVCRALSKGEVIVSLDRLLLYSGCKKLQIFLIVPIVEICTVQVLSNSKAPSGCTH